MSSSKKTHKEQELSFELNLAQDLAKVIDTPRALTVYLMCKHKEFEQLATLEIDPDDYEDPDSFALDYLITGLLQKSPSLPLSVDKREAAELSFLESERQCKLTNDRLRGSERPPWYAAFERNIAAILGPLKHQINRICDLASFGPGATATIPGRGSVLSDKYRRPLSLTPDLIPFRAAIMGDFWFMANSAPGLVVNGNRFTTVPKNAKTDRGICIEPSLNIYFQKGIGAVIRELLARSGINLNDQGINQMLSKRAWKDSLATIDLSKASDTLAAMIIIDAFPDDWLHILWLARSHRTLFKECWVELEKFSSMGNGYTFELESLVFTAVARAIVPQYLWDDVSVYGDDIIVPSQYADSLIDALEFLGFSANRSKSHLAGNFFESCGAHWFKGKSVRPFWLKGSQDRIPYAVQVANKLRLFLDRLGGGTCDSRFKPIWDRLRKSAPRVWRLCKVPPEFGDSGFIVSQKEIMKKALPGQWEGYGVKHVVLRPKYKDYQDYFAYFRYFHAAPPRGHHQTDYLHDPPTGTQSPTKGREPIRGLFGIAVARRGIVLQWPEGLEWV